MKNLFKYLFILATTVAFTACNSSDEPTEPTMMVSEFVTYSGSANGQSHFKFQTLNDSPTIYIHANRTLPATIEEGQRLHIVYNIPLSQTIEDGGLIDLLQVSAVLSDTVTTVQSVDPADLSPIQITTAPFRTGQYINIIGRIGIGQDTDVKITALESSLTTGVADLYFTPTDVNSQAFPQQVPISVDISPVWNLRGISAVRLHLNNSADPSKQVFTFNK